MIFYLSKEQIVVQLSHRYENWLVSKDPVTDLSNHCLHVIRHLPLWCTRGRTYIMITYVSKENNLGPGDKIRYIWGLKGPIFIL